MLTFDMINLGFGLGLRLNYDKQPANRHPFAQIYRDVRISVATSKAGFTGQARCGGRTD